MKILNINFKSSIKHEKIDTSNGVAKIWRYPKNFLKFV